MRILLQVMLIFLNYMVHLSIEIASLVEYTPDSCDLRALKPTEISFNHMK